MYQCIWLCQLRNHTHWKFTTPSDKRLKRENSNQKSRAEKVTQKEALDRYNLKNSEAFDPADIRSKLHVQR